ncbi:MAG: MBL fold metallo-hydrolase [Deltaproteobacteria bacterium]|nr:MBL fold metallo-hydrolase [Deltaproteobacteria bacterium]
MRTKLFGLLVLLGIFLLGSAGFVMADSPFQGSYKGTFKGNFGGNWKCTVDANGRISDFSIDLAPEARGRGVIDREGNLKVTLSFHGGAMTAVWTANVTKDLIVKNGKTDRGGTFEGRGMRNPASAKSEPSIKVILLGTGTAIPNPQRACASTLIVAGDKRFLIDTGRGFLNNMVKAGIRDVSAVLFTHYHSDHIGEFGELMVLRGLFGAKEPLKVIGPKGAKKVVSAMLEAYSLDNAYRKAHHKDKWYDASEQVRIQEFQSGVVYDDGDIKIRMFEVDHSPAKPAVGYRIDYLGKSVVVSGDTKKVPQMTEMAKGCDILVHEALNLQLVNMSEARLRDHPRLLAMTKEMVEYHTTTMEVAEIARDAGVRNLVLTHLVPSIPVNSKAEQMFIRGMSDIYKGPILVGRDGMVIDTNS